VTLCLIYPELKGKLNVWNWRVFEFVSLNKVEYLAVKIAGKEIAIKGTKEVPFKDYQQKTKIKKFYIWRDFLIPIELKSIQYLELDRYTKSAVNYKL